MRTGLERWNQGKVEPNDQGFVIVVWTLWEVLEQKSLSTSTRSWSGDLEKKKKQTVLSGDDGSITKWGVLGTMGQFELAQNYQQQLKLLLDAIVGFD